VREALRRQNTDVPGGNVEAGRREMTLRTLGRYSEPREFNELVIADMGGSQIRVRDVGRVEDGTKEQRSFARLNGAPTVTLEIRRQSGANTVAVIENAKRELDRIKGQMPADVKLEIIRDQSRYISAALHEIETHLVLGSILACLALDHHCGRRHSGLRHRHLRDDEGARFHAQQRHDARARVDGGRGD
jgi:HAE1 family hydrophobic/amphiphilic exporter-1